MRKITFFTLVFLSWAGIANSQVVSFPEKDAIWKEEYLTIAGPFSRHFALCGDTLINGKSYSQLVQLELDTTGEITGKTYTAAVRADGEKVWVKPETMMDEVLLYDFGLQPGQEIQLYNLAAGSQVSRTVDSVKLENLAGANRRVIYFKPELGEAGEFWIQGFGSNYGVLWRGHIPIPDFAFSLLCFQHADEYLNLTDIECFLPEIPVCETVNASETPVTVSLKLTAFPNPSSNEVSFAISQAKSLEEYQLKIYAANGKLMKTVEQISPETKLPQAETLKPGFYIAVLETKKTGRVAAHCTFVSGR